MTPEPDPAALPAPRPLPSAAATRLAEALLAWYRAHQRRLPWREELSSYSVWVSETMLQQTRSATVIPYFERWMERFPSIEALAAADEQEVLHAWQGLGYYSRARNLLRAAHLVVQRYGGILPDEPRLLASLPGVGRYTAGAIASIAGNRPVPAVDGNVTRVLCRLFALEGNPTRAPLSRRLWQLAAALIPSGHAREFNPALMELGATVCLPASPRCGECPVAPWCRARELARQREFPQTPARPSPTPVAMAAALACRAGQVLLVRPALEARRWTGLWQFPSVELRPHEDPSHAAERALRECAGIDCAAGERLAVLHHTVTRYRIRLEAYLTSPYGEGVYTTPPRQQCSWFPPSALQDLPLPTPHRRLADALREHKWA